MDQDQVQHTLEKMGDYLDAIDDVRERNEKGFNRFDKDSWPKMRGRIPGMINILRKYQGQLAPVFGKDSCQIFSNTLHLEVYIEPILVDSRVCFKLSGYPKQWDRFRALQAEFGLKYNNKYGCAVLPISEIANFAFDAFLAAMNEIGVSCLPLPEMPDNQDLIVQSAWDALDDRAKELFVLRYIPERQVFSFRFSFSNELNKLFSNKSGLLSGIMECIPGVWSRETTSVALAKEALEKAKFLVPHWTFVTEDLQKFEAAFQAKIDAARSPIAQVESLICEDYKLFGFQNEFVRFLDDTKGNALIGAEMGLGKTLISLAWCAANKKRVLVVCPKVVRRTWVEEAKKFFPSYYVKTQELRPDKLKKAGMPNLKDTTIATVNFASFAKFVPAIEDAHFDVLIVDESHNIKNPDALITQYIHYVAKNFPHKILLSGTAIKNKKQELFPQIDLVAPGLFQSSEHLRNATIGGTWHKIQSCYKTMAKDEVLKDLPPKMRTIVGFDVTSCPDLQSSMDIGQITALKNDVAIAKAATTVEFVKEILDSSDSAVLVFSESVDAAKKIAELLSDLAILHHGQQRDDVREASKQEFQNPESIKRVFVSTRQSLAVGATLTRADKVVFNDLPWTPADVRQAEDRTHRIGQTKTVNVYWVKASENFWDSNIVDLLYRKMDLAKKVLEGKQLSAEERKFIDEPIDVAEILERFKAQKKATRKKKGSEAIKKK